MKLIITGSIAFDTLMSFPGKFSDHLLANKLDRISVSFLVDTLTKQRGGCAANIAYNLALLEEHPCLVGTVGRDFTEYSRILEKIGVDTSGVRVIEDDYTASFYANTDEDGNQIASFYTGAMRFARDISLRDIEGLDNGLIIISPNDPDAMKKTAKECQKMNLPYIYDPGQQIVRLTGEDLRKGIKGARVLILNEYELEMLKNKTGISDNNLLECCETFVVTLGDKGSVIHHREGSLNIPVVKPVKIIDPTGVGDAFRAGLMKGISHNLSWHTTGRMGSLAAAYVLETDGPQNHSYTLKQFVKRYGDIFGESEEIRRMVKN